MKRISNLSAFFNRIRPVLFLPVAVVLCSISAQAQVAKQVAKPINAPVKSQPAAATAATSTTQPPQTAQAKPTTTTAKPAAATGLIADGEAHISTTRLIHMNDPEYKKTPKYANRQKKYNKAMDDTARRTVPIQGGHHIFLKLVKNPSFEGQPTTYQGGTVKGTEKKETKKTDSIQWDCASSTVVLTASSTSFLNADYEQQAGYIYPGAIYTFDNFFGGNYNEPPGPRYPITLINEDPNATGSGYVVVKSPAQSTVLAGVKKLRQSMRGPAVNESFTYKVYETGNNATQALRVSGGGSYAGFSASNDYSSSSSSNSVNLTIDATKYLYTIDLQDQDSGFFVDPKTENIRNLMVMSQVSYGIRVLANLTYTFNTSQEADQFKAAYSGFGASVNFTLGEMSKSSSVSNTINCYIVGGASKNATPSFNKKELEHQIQAMFANVSNESVQPIAYTFKDMAGDVIGSYSATDDFHERNCVPNTNGARLKAIWAKFSTGPDGKEADDHYTFAVYGGNAGTHNNFNGYDNNPPQTVDSHEPFIAQYKTGPLNVVYNRGEDYSVPLTMNNFLTEFTGTSGVYHDLNMGYFVKNGGLIHLHIYPNGADTWNISSLVLTLDFDGAPSQTITFNKFDVSEKSTEMTLYFDGTFHER
jgi:hypothetical protein